MATEEKPLRADAERNRQRLLDAAEELFGERGLEVGVGEIAQRAGVGRGTLFRNFPSKEHLIAAIVVERMNEALARGRALADADDPGTALFDYLEDLVIRQQTDRALFEAVEDTFLANADIQAALAEVVDVLDALLTRAQEAGAVRTDIGAVDLVMLLKGVCQVAVAFSRIDPEITSRQFDLVRSALTPTAGASALRGRAPTLGDLERAHVADASLRAALGQRG